ncbi:MAG: hypothetical protein ACI31G_01085 [Bacilli bacterium]
MRRFWAYIVLAFTALLAMGTTFTNLFVKSSSNIEYQDGKEIVFRITNKDNKDLEVEEGASLEIAEVMKQRLDNSDITNYEVDTVGNDTVKVIFSEQNTTNYENIIYYLSFNGKLALSTSTDTVAIDDEFLLEDSKAYLDTVNNYPSIVIPVNTDNSEYKAVIEEAKRQLEAGEGESSTDSDGNTTTTVYLYLWCDFEEGYDIYSKTLSDNEDYDENVAQKIIMKFNYTDGAFFPDDEENKLASAVNIDSNKDGVASVTEVKNAYNTARYFINLINAEALDYDITFMYEKTVPAWTENLISYGTNATLAMSKTFISSVIALIIVTLILVIFFRLSAVSTFVLTLGSIFAGIGFTILFGVEFNLAAIVGLVAVAIVSVASSIIYFTKFKEECYKGRSIKKANTEASKKSLLPIVDIHVALIVVGAFIFLLGGKLLIGFASTAVLGGLSSLVLNTLVLKGAMWLLTNNTSFTNKYSIFGVEPENVPNSLNEEKQKYYGPYEKSELTKKKKTVSIVTAVAFAASLVGMITFGVIGNGNFYNAPSSLRNSQIFIETSTTNTSLKESVVSEFLDQFYVYNSSDTEATQLSTLIDSDGIESYENVVIEEGGNEVTYKYFVCTLKVALSDSVNSYITTDEDNVVPLNDLLNETLSDENIDSNATASIKEVKSLSVTDTPNTSYIMLATFVGTAVVSLYLMARYGLSKGLPVIVLNTAICSIPFGIFALTRIVTTSYVSVSLPIVAILALLLEIIFMNKNKELILEDKKHDRSVENREEIMKRANALALGPAISLASAAIVTLLCLYGFGPEATSSLFAMALIGSLIALGIISVLYGPISQWLYKLFSKVSFDVKPTKEKKRKKKSNKQNTSEPEEAIFIGIND